jgi:hypothetical protein
MENTHPRQNREHLSTGDRVGETFALIGPVFLLAFFGYHQWLNTGFFTEDFGLVAQIALYGPILLSFIAPLIRIVTGSRNFARPFEAFTNLCLAAGSYYLLRIFPLDYSHLADVLPRSLRFLLLWVTDPIAKIVLTIMVVAGLITAIATIIKFFTVLARDLAEA